MDKQTRNLLQFKGFYLFSFFAVGSLTPLLSVYLSEVEKIIAELDTNNLSPMQAFNILIDLQEKVKEE